MPWARDQLIGQRNNVTLDSDSGLGSPLPAFEKLQFYGAGGLLRMHSPDKTLALEVRVSGRRIRCLIFAPGLTEANSTPDAISHLFSVCS